MSDSPNGVQPPQFRMQVLAQFTRDLSFENVVAQKGIQSGDVQPDIQVQVSLDARKRQADNQFEVITNLAKEQSCVIVGRCADYVLRDMDHVTHIFLYASLEKRVERIMRVENVDADKARELIRKTDKQRASYYNYYTENRWGEAKNYDLCLNATLGREACADLIVAAARAMQEADK